MSPLLCVIFVFSICTNFTLACPQNYYPFLTQNKTIDTENAVIYFSDYDLNLLYVKNIV